MSCCSDLDWTGVDQTREHHPECRELLPNRGEYFTASKDVEMALRDVVKDFPQQSGDPPSKPRPRARDIRTAALFDAIEALCNKCRQLQVLIQFESLDYYHYIDIGGSISRCCASDIWALLAVEDAAALNGRIERRNVGESPWWVVPRDKEY